MKKIEDVEYELFVKGTIEEMRNLNRKLDMIFDELLYLKTQIDNIELDRKEKETENNIKENQLRLEYIKLDRNDSRIYREEKKREFEGR